MVDLTVQNSSEIAAAMAAIKMQAQDQARRDRISQPSRSSARDTVARRRDSASTTLSFGSQSEFDLSPAIIDTVVIRIPKS